MSGGKALFPKLCSLVNIYVNLLYALSRFIRDDTDVYSGGELEGDEEDTAIG